MRGTGINTSALERLSPRLLYTGMTLHSNNARAGVARYLFLPLKTLY